MERIRVLRVIARMNVGGPAVQISGLMRGLDPERYDHRLVTGWCADDEADYLQTQAPDVVVTRIDGLGRAIRPWDDLSAVQGLVARIRDFRPDVIHTHTAKAGVVGRVAAELARSRAALVHTYHGHLLHGYFSPAKTKAVIGLERALAARTDRLVAVGPQVRDDLLEAGIGRPDQFVVIPPGLVLPPMPSAASARAGLGLSADAFVVGLIGRITGIKRPDRFAEVAELLRDRPDVVFLVAGAGDEEEALRRAVEDRDLRVQMLGWRSDIENLLAACDAVLLTSDNEGTPLSLIQAGMAGLPVVATNVGSVKDVVVDGQTGLLAAAEARPLADQVRRLADDHELAVTLGAAAQERTTRLYGVDRLVADHDRLYRELVDPAAVT